MISSSLRNFILGILLGGILVASLFAWRQSRAMAAEPVSPFAPERVIQ
jgi:hypothetical protein